MLDVRCNSRRLSVPWGLFGMAVLVFTAENVLAHFDQYFSDSNVAAYRFPGLACRAAAKCEVLCFGDSLIKHGILPLVFEDRLGMSAYNLAAPGALPASPYILLRRVLESGGRPSAVLVEFKPRNLAFDPRPLTDGVTALPTFRESVELCWDYADADFATILCLSRMFISYRDRRGLRCVIRKLVDPSYPLMFTPSPPFWRNWGLNQGGQLNPKNAQSVSKEGPADLRLYLFPRWQCDPRNERHLVKFLKLAAAHRLRVYWLMPPAHPRLQAWRDEKGADAPYDRFVRTLQAGFRNIKVLDARHSGYGADLFWDAVHLDRDGALAFSAQVAEALRHSSKAGEPLGPTWLALPRMILETSPRALEDVDQSRLALSAPYQGKRQ
jgi:hypothetical protein